MNKILLFSAIAIWTLFSPVFPLQGRGSEFHTHSETCDASGVVLLPSSGSRPATFLVANDEDNILRAYAVEKDGPPLAISGGDLNEPLGLNPLDDEADLEAATWIGQRAFWIGSHSRSNKGKLRDARHQFFATTVEVAPTGAITLGKPSKSASHDLIDAFVARDPTFEAAIGPGVKEDSKLAPKMSGFNIEGLAVGPDGNSAFIGLRNPLSPSGKAYIVPFENPIEVVDSDAPPKLGKPIQLELEGRGIRSLEYDPTKKLYYIVAGPAQSSGSFELYRWSGLEKEEPIPVKGSAEAFAALPKFGPEALVVDASGNVLHIFSDDGEREMVGSTVCKDLDSPKDKFFRSIKLKLD